MMLFTETHSQSEKFAGPLSRIPAGQRIARDLRRGPLPSHYPHLRSVARSEQGAAPRHAVQDVLPVGANLIAPRERAGTHIRGGKRTDARDEALG